MKLRNVPGSYIKWTRHILDTQGCLVPKSEPSRLSCDSLWSATFRRKINVLHMIFINELNILNSKSVVIITRNSCPQQLRCAITFEGVPQHWNKVRGKQFPVFLSSSIVKKSELLLLLCSAFGGIPKNIFSKQ